MVQKQSMNGPKMDQKMFQIYTQNYIFCLIQSKMVQKIVTNSSKMVQKMGHKMDQKMFQKWTKKCSKITHKITFFVWPKFVTKISCQKFFSKITGHKYFLALFLAISFLLIFTMKSSRSNGNARKHQRIIFFMPSCPNHAVRIFSSNIRFVFISKYAPI